MNLEEYQIKSNETIIDSDWTKLTGRLTKEDAFGFQKRIYDILAKKNETKTVKIQ